MDIRVTYGYDEYSNHVLVNRDSRQRKRRSVSACGIGNVIRADY
ncbi:hypothetical protein ACPCXF_17355 [Lysinibacillus agricola]